MKYRYRSEVDSIINAFGGTGAMARQFGVLPSAVSNWRKYRRFPSRLHYRIDKAAGKLGIRVPEELFEDPDDLTDSHGVAQQAAE